MIKYKIVVEVLDRILWVYDDCFTTDLFYETVFSQNKINNNL